VFLGGATVGSLYFFGILKIRKTLRRQEQRHFRAEIAELGKDTLYQCRLIRLLELSVHEDMLPEAKNKGKFCIQMPRFEDWL